MCTCVTEQLVVNGDSLVVFEEELCNDVTDISGAGEGLAHAAASGSFEAIVWS
jgi:hypothetical protein